MAAPASIPFPCPLAEIASEAMLAAMTPAQRGIWHALCDLAWGQGCRLPADVAYLARELRCTAADMQCVVERASRTHAYADGPVLQFPALAALREELARRMARVSELQRSRRLGKGSVTRTLRLADPAMQPPEGGDPPGHRARPPVEPAVRPAVEPAVHSGTQESSCAQRSLQKSANPSARKSDCDEVDARSARPEDFFGGRRRAVEDRILARSADLKALAGEALRAEIERRRDVYHALASARFGVGPDTERLPDRTCRVMASAPWLTAKMAAGHAWDAARLAAEAAGKGEAFNAIGFVIAMCGCATRNVGVPEPTSVFFEDAWRKRQDLRARADAARSSRAVDPAAGVPGKAVAHA